MRAFKTGALADAGARSALRWNVPVRPVATPGELFALAQESGAKAIVTALVPVGHQQAEIDRWTRAGEDKGISLLQIARRWDELFWPHAKAGFFRLKERIPALMAQLDLRPERPPR